MSKAGEDSIYVERGNFEQVPDALWKEGATTPRAVVLYLALSKRGSREDRGVPKRSTLARDMGVSSVRTVDAAIDELVEKGWLLITPRLREDADQGQTSNHYRLLWTPITSTDDERLVKHQRESSEFDRIMAEKQAKNGNEGARSVRRASWLAPVQNSAPSPRAENCAPPAQKIDTGPAQETALQESYLSRTTPLENQTTPLVPADAATGDDAQELTLVSPTYVAPTPQPSFEDFWAVYPKTPTGKQAAKRAWDKAVKIASPSFIVDGARRFAADPNLPSKAEEQFIPHASTWLNAGRWEDGPLPPRAGGRGRAYDDTATWGTEAERVSQAEAKRKAWDDMTEEERQAEIASMFDEDNGSAASHGG